MDTSEKATQCDVVECDIIVDTSQYSGNYERELCAWMTGLIGDCGVGEEIQSAALQELPAETAEWLRAHIILDNDRGCMRPVAICPTPGFVNDGMGKLYREEDYVALAPRYPAYQSIVMKFSEKPPTELLQLLYERACSFSRAPVGEFTTTDFDILNMRIITEEIRKTTSTVPEEISDFL